MKYKEFVDKACKQDSRNVFETGKNSEKIPEELSLIYAEFDPVDVEVNIDGAIIRLVPCSEYQAVQDEYGLEGERCIFATCNGDPIFTKNGSIFTNVHGANGVPDEKLADSIEEYFDKIK